jgi:hypothetical protein
LHQREAPWDVLFYDRERERFRMEHPMINWPNMLHDIEQWADGFLTGAAATSLIAIAGMAIVLLARAI